MRRMLGVATLCAGVLGLGGGAAAARADETTSREQYKVEKQIQANLQDDRDLANNPIDVRVADGVATLKGTVDSEAERATAVRLASVTGVRVVEDQLAVGADRAMDDGAITATIKREYLASADLRRVDIGVSTKNGVVTLVGTVPSDGARRMAIEMARQTAGVTRVDDHLRVIGSAPADPEVPLR
jgi:osmotically-inducible protein OsmY